MTVGVGEQFCEELQLRRGRLAVGRRSRWLRPASRNQWPTMLEMVSGALEKVVALEASATGLVKVG